MLAQNPLHVYVGKARKAGVKTTRSRNGGGWLKLAKACGGVDIQTKADAKDFLRCAFEHGGAPMTVDPALKAMQVGLDQARERFAAKKPPKKIGPARLEVYQGDVNSPAFLTSFEWRRVRMVALKREGARCQCCGASPADGAVMNVDHIKSRRKHPHLALDAENLQVLCGDCNHGKGAWDETDWRPSPQTEDEQRNIAHLRSI